ncbi:MAG: TM1812 family CRISPR-associated protein [Methanobacteriota archaeon]
MRCISYIGRGRERETRFCRDNQCIVTDLVQEAVWHLWHPDEIILCISRPEDAFIAAECETREITVRKLWIPEGIREDDLWETFTLVSSAVNHGEDILFEITGGDPALPFITTLIATYLKEVKQIRIIGVIFSPPPDEFGMRHFVDLMPIMGIIDWIRGINALTSHTDAENICKLLTGLQGEIFRRNTEPDPPTHLIGWSHLLRTFTNAVRLNRPVDALYAGWGISQDLPVVRKEVGMFAPILTPIMDDMEAIGKMAALPHNDDLTPSYLMMQHHLIRYQIDKGLDFQAVSLSREWLISCSMILFDIGKRWLDPDTRHVVSRTLTGVTLNMQGIPSENTQYTHLLFEGENWKEMVKIWEQVSDLRNDLAHCGMNEREESLKSLMKRTRRLPNDLLNFGRYAGIGEFSPVNR